LRLKKTGLEDKQNIFYHFRASGATANARHPALAVPILRKKADVIIHVLTRLLGLVSGKIY
jgi:hypothetical protein